MDIKPSRQRPALKGSSSPAETAKAQQPTTDELLATLDASEPLPVDAAMESGESATPRRKFSVLKWVLIAVAAIIVLAVACGVGWYQWAIGPVSTNETRQKFVVNSGETPSMIANNLEQARLVRSKLAFELYTKIHGSADELQAGTYKLAPNQSVASIVGELVKGQNATYDVLIPPGLTLKQLADPTVKGSFAAQGFSAEEINRAFNATYSSVLLKDKPVGASLEGYIFPETFQAQEGDTLESVLERSFDTLYDRLAADGMVEKFAAKGLTLHGALTLGSIIQEETSNADVQRQVAQVFLSRLGIGMMLGSDVTFIYAANQLGVVATPELDSPYNTRIHTGLPPGPIATMNYSALQAIANPAEGDYLFFVAGDDGTVYFSRTNEEHEQQVRQYCTKLCS